MVVSGGFFLGPDRSSDGIVRALIDLPHTSSVADLAAAINSCLLKDARLPGFSLEAVGIVMQRALGCATSWDDHISDVIGSVTLGPRLCVALDEVLAARTARGEIGSSLRVWDRDQPPTMIGSFQSYRNEIDEEGREHHGINMARRITGGGAMFMEPGNCVTYSLLAPGSLVEGPSFEYSYEFLDQWVIEALTELGTIARYMPLNDIASDRGRIAGATQYRLASDVVLRHVTMVYDIDADKILQVLWIGREKLSNRGTKLANKRIDPLRSQTQLPRDQITDPLPEHFESRYSTRHHNYTDDELVAAAELAEKRLATPEWTRRIP